MLETHVLVDRGRPLPLDDGEHRRLGRVENLDRAVLQLDRARGELGVDGLVGTSGDGARDTHDVFAPQVGRTVDDALDHAAAVAYVDEGKMLAVLPAGRHPAAHDDLTTDVADGELPAVVRAHASGTIGADCRHRRRPR